ncbi:MAG: hypothetical protein FGF53_04245 [Candidatus Brockarchaeota archaeon]|nr:hypothetical protein [Candidatus Brockarchaeota archaeon]MBO3809315.1 hypothetical protein [Candidatus Brockarchaeota archaeon]
MSVITVRVPRSLKRRMSRFKNVNWSEVIREAILERIAVEEKLGDKDWELVRKAAKETDRLREAVEARDGKCDYDSTETIRNWREIRIWRG